MEVAGKYHTVLKKSVEVEYSINNIIGLEC